MTDQFDANLYQHSEVRYDTVGTFNSSEIEIWMSIQKARQAYSGDEEFRHWLLDQWGVELFLADDGHNLSPHFKIQSPEKFTMFLLKYKK